MTTTQWLKAKMTPPQEQLKAIKDGKDPKAAAKLRKPIQAKLDTEHGQGAYLSRHSKCQSKAMGVKHGATRISTRLR